MYAPPPRPALRGPPTPRPRLAGCERELRALARNVHPAHLPAAHLLLRRAARLLPLMPRVLQPHHRGGRQRDPQAEESLLARMQVPPLNRSALPQRGSNVRTVIAQAQLPRGALCGAPRVARPPARRRRRRRPGDARRGSRGRRRLALLRPELSDTDSGRCAHLTQSSHESAHADRGKDWGAN